MFAERVGVATAVGRNGDDAAKVCVAFDGVALHNPDRVFLVQATGIPDSFSVTELAVGVASPRPDLGGIGLRSFLDHEEVPVSSRDRLGTREWIACCAKHSLNGDEAERVARVGEGARRRQAPGVHVAFLTHNRCREIVRSCHRLRHVAVR